MGFWNSLPWIVQLAVELWAGGILLSIAFSGLVLLAAIIGAFFK